MANPPQRPLPTPDQAPDPRAVLMRELAAEGRLDASTEARLRWDLARRNELAGDTPGAVKAYLVAYNLAPTFQPPLDALVRIFSRRRSLKNLGRLLEAKLNGARSDGERASALLDLAAFCEDHGGDEGSALEHLKQAILLAPESAAVALEAERLARSLGDTELTTQSLELRSRSTVEPSLRGVLLHEVAAAREAAGDPDGAFAALDDALAIGAVKWRTLETLERLARRLDRPEILARALEGMAEMAFESARGAGADAGSGAFSIDRFVDEARATGESVACLYEAGMSRLEKANDALGAAAALKRAQELRPADLVIRLAHIRALRSAGAHDAMSEAVQELIDRGIDDEVARAVEFELAEVLRQSNPERAIEILTRLLDEDPRSPAARARLESWLSEDSEAWLDELERRAASLSKSSDDDETATAHADDAAWAQLDWWRAAIIATRKSNDFARGANDFQHAIEQFPEGARAVLRDFYEEALSAGQLAVAKEALERLLQLELEPEERSALLADRVRLAYALADEASASSAITQAIDDEVARKWAPDAARVHAAEASENGLLARAHLLLAEDTDDETAAAHYAAAARAAVRAGDFPTAETHLQAAIQRVPGHRYSVALLEEVFRAQGQADRVVELLRNAAEAQAGPRAAVVSLLNAGAAAEAAGDYKLAAETYEQAADHDPSSVSPLWALARLAEKDDDDDLRVRALEALSEQEMNHGQAGRITLELGERYAWTLGKPELAEGPLKACLESEEVGPEAALAIALLPEDRISPNLRISALEHLASATGAAGKLLLEDAATSGLADNLDLEIAERLSNAALEADPDSHLGLLTQLLTGEPDERAETWLSLASTIDDVGVRDAMTLHGLRSMIVAKGGDATDDAFLLAQELAENESYSASVAVDETLEASDDPDARFVALQGRLLHASEETQASLRAATGRAGAAARREEAVALLRQATEADPDDLASWEALRVAARDAAEWNDVAAACDTLAQHIEGAAQYELLEESAAVLMDHLELDAEAESRLQRVVLAAPQRPNAYHRLHDLVAERGDTEALLAMVGARIDVIDDADQLERLYYEMARLHRSRGELDEALEAIENVLMLDENHVGCMALEVEIFVSTSNWASAVESLRAIADADVPARQKRVSLLGAADFLEKKLDDPMGAITELQKIEAMGLADLALYERMAALAARAGAHDACVHAHQHAADLCNGPARAEHLQAAGSLQRDQLDDRVGALLSFRQALSVDPVALAPASAVNELLPDASMREAHAEEFESAVRASMVGKNLEATDLRKILAAAAWRQDRTLVGSIHSVLVALGLASDVERQSMPATPQLTLANLDDAAIRTLLAPGDEGAFAKLSESAHSALCYAVGLHTARLSLGRSDLVSARDASPLRDEVLSFARSFGLQEGDFYHGGEALQIVAFPNKKERTDWALGQSIRAPALGPMHRFLVGQQAMAASRGTTALIERSAADAATLLFAAAAVADAPLSAGHGRGAEWHDAISKGMSRRARKAIALHAADIDNGGIAMEGYTRAAQRSAQRAGLLASMDPATAIAVITGSSAASGEAQRSEDARALLTFWISPEFNRLRDRLGLS